MKWDSVVHGGLAIAYLNMSTAILVRAPPMRWLVAIVLLIIGVHGGPTWPLDVPIGVLA